MRVLWTVNIIPANISKKLHIQNEVFGGWIESMAFRLKLLSDIELVMACRSEPGLLFDETVDGIRYCSLAYGVKDGRGALKQRCFELINAFHPDIIQIEGTEFPHAKAMLEAGKDANVPVIVSMQGILNGQYNYQCGHLPVDDMMFSNSLTNIVSAWILHLRKTKWYAPRMIPEREVIGKAEYILGRTTWDRAHTYEINPDAQYFHCNRSLRIPFYENNWELRKAERHSIYVGNGYYALKGVHFVVRAVSLLMKEYPNIKVYVAGHRPFTENDKRPFYKKGYGEYLRKLIRECDVENRIIFTGPLNAEQVAEKLTSVHTYVLCSIVENSPNTLGEAMMVGTPCIASYVGGVSDMVTDEEEALIYRDDDPVLLAWKIKQIFDNDDLALKLSESAKRRARITHDPQRNALQLIKIYETVLNKDGE